MGKTVVKTKIQIDRSDEFKNLQNAATNLQNIMKKATDQLNAKYNKRVKFNLELMVERAVDQFYESYTPNIYDRKEGLYKAAKITVNDDEWNIDTGADYMKTSYRVGNEYIYVNSFEKGWHGGSIDGPEHPEPGVPWWKLYGEWYKRATRGPSPEELINEQDPQSYIDEQELEYDKEWGKIVEPYYEQFMQALNNFYGR